MCVCVCVCFFKYDSAEIEGFLDDYNSISIDKRYRLGITVLLFTISS